MYTNTLTLNNNIKIPQLGLGTWFIDDANVAEYLFHNVSGAGCSSPDTNSSCLFPFTD